MQEHERYGELRREQQARIAGLRAKVQALYGTEIDSWDSSHDDLDASERFWSTILAFEKAPWTTYATALAERGYVPPDVDTLADGQLRQALWQLVRQLAEMRVFLVHTDHLSDRQVFVRLVEDLLHDEVKLLGHECPHWSCELDLLNTGSDDDLRYYLRYYADAEFRQNYVRQFPQELLPERTHPPYRRDGWLPRPSSEPVRGTS